MNKDKNTHKKQVYNQQEINWLQGMSYSRFTSHRFNI